MDLNEISNEITYLFNKNEEEIYKLASKYIELNNNIITYSFTRLAFDISKILFGNKAFIAYIANDVFMIIYNDFRIRIRLNVIYDNDLYYTVKFEFNINFNYN